MGDVWRAFCARYLGWRYVTLIDVDGERNIRRIRFRGGKAFAVRVGFGIQNVWLLDGEQITGACYVKRWEPYEPFAEPQWPRP